MFPLILCVPKIPFATFSFGYVIAFISSRVTNSDIVNFPPSFHRSITTPNVP